MKRRRTDIDRAVNISRFAKPHVAELPLAFARRASEGLDTQRRAAESDDDVVVAMHMPEGRVAGRNCDIPNAHKFIFKFRVMTRLAADFNRRLSAAHPARLNLLPQRAAREHAAVLTLVNRDTAVDDHELHTH